MAMQLKKSLSSLVCRYFSVGNYVFVAQSSMLARAQSISSVSSKSSSTMDCLPNPKTPWLKLSSGRDPTTGLVVDSFYSLLDNQEVRLNRKDCLGVPDTARCFATTGEWLAFVDPNDDCPVYLTNPFFNCNDRKMGGVIRLPSLATIPTCAGVFRDPSTGRILFDLFAIATDVPDELSIDSVDTFGFFDLNEMAEQIKNLSISHLDPHHSDCVAVALQGYVPTLAYSRLWDGRDTRLGWIGLQEDYHSFHFSNQVVFSHSYKMFYTINDNGIEVFDLFNDRKKRSKRVILFPFGRLECKLDREFGKEKNEELKGLRNLTCSGCYDEEKQCQYDKRFHLVVLNDNGTSSDLVLLVRHYCSFIHDNTEKTLHFDVFKVDFPSRLLFRMKTLNEQCVFVGADQSFFLSASKFPGLQPNSIYFIDQYDHCMKEGLRKDRGIFNLENNKIESLEHPFNGDQKLFWIAPSTLRNT